jgi:hypothetical protein
VRGHAQCFRKIASARAGETGKDLPAGKVIGKLARKLAKARQHAS